MEHKKIIPRQEPIQWSFEMMKDAAILVLKINIICLEYGYELKDCHQFNIMFDGTVPVWVDFGSIAKRNKDLKKWAARDEFLASYYYPMKLWSRGFDGLIRQLMKSVDLDLKEMMRIYYKMPARLVDFCMPLISNHACKEAEADMRELMRGLGKLKHQKDTQWGAYQDSYWDKSNKRFDYEIGWINRMPDIESMVEVGANQGAFSYLAAMKTQVKRILATDYDEQAVDTMYKRLKYERITGGKITPLILDFVWTPEEQLKRYRSDLAVANALTHHLLLAQGMPMKGVAERLSILADKYLIVEFMERGLGQSRAGLPDWYTLENFVESLSARFSEISIYKADSKRTIIFATKK